MYKIKRDKYRNQYEILLEGIPVFSVPTERFVELANVIVKYVVGKDFKISMPNKEETARGYGKYYYIKGILLAGWHDIKKRLKNENDKD